MSMLLWLESTRLAAVIGDSTLLTGALSAIHLLGTTLVGGGALLSGLRFVGVLLPDRPLSEVMAAAGRGLMTGLTISAATGVLLLAPRASSAAQNGFFQVKMVLILAALACHVSLRRAARQRQSAGAVVRLAGAVGAMLWFGVVLAGAAFILLGE